jgi:hypothetical protein
MIEKYSLKYNLLALVLATEFHEFADASAQGIGLAIYAKIITEKTI